MNTDRVTSQAYSNINNDSFISLGKLYDGGYEAKLTENNMTVCEDETPITIVPRCTTA